jgi:hypothetical protein
VNWREYQEKTAAFFASLGYTTSVDETLHGVRDKHNVDVVVRFSKHAFECLWLVECKLWASRIPKEKILAFQSIIDDIGADKGIILSEEGFQSGCFACATRTNILLSSLSELRETHREDLHRAFVDSLLIELERAASRARELAPIVSTSRPEDKFQSWTSKFPVELVGRVSVIEMALRSYRDGKLPVVIGFDEDRDTRILANSADEIIAAQRDVLKRIDDLRIRLEDAR